MAIVANGIVYGIGAVAIAMGVTIRGTGGRSAPIIRLMPETAVL